MLYAGRARAVASARGGGALEPLLAVLIVTGVMAGIRWFERRRRRLAWVREAALVEWQPIEDDLARAVWPLTATLEGFRDEDDEFGALIVVRGLRGDMTLRSLGDPTGDLTTGHLGFDQQLYVQGPTHEVRAALDAATRDAFLELLRSRLLRRGHVLLERGELRAMLAPEGLISLTEALGDAVARIGQIARRMSETIDVPAALAAQVRRDPVSGVRLACLRTLLREYPKASIVQPLLREAALEDADPEVRLEAALALRQEGVAALEELVAEPSVDDALAARAVEALGRKMPPQLARAVLRQELSAAGPGRRPRTATACAAALGRMGDAGDEELLTQALQPGRDEGLRLAAARALGPLGSAAAVPALSDLAGSDEAAVRRAGREAIALIQSRLTGATPGQLSLDPGGAGQLSLAEDAAGRLSEVPPPEGDEGG